MSHYQEQGRAAYKRKEYEKALGYFDRAIGLTPSVQLLDNRSACHERLDDLSAALKDAKKAIQLSKADPTGYLRAGRILRKMEKKTVALEIYSYGLKCVKPVGQGYELLRSSRGELMSELSPSKSVDPLTQLPRELAEQVLDHLNFKQLMNTCLVSKGWTQFVRSSPNLWWHLDLSQAWKRKVKTAFISRAINVGRQKLTAATLSNLFDSDFEKALKALVRHCPLQDLTLANTGCRNGDELVQILKKAEQLRSLNIGKDTYIMGSQSLSEIMHKAAPTLQSLRCDDLTSDRVPSGLRPLVTFHGMKKLDLSWSKEWQYSYGLIQHIANFPNLDFLKLHQLKNFRHHQPAQFDLSSLTNLTCVDLFLNIPDIAVLRLPRSIKTLRLGSFTRSPTYLSAAEWDLPELASLSVSVNSLIFEDVLEALKASSTMNSLTGTELSIYQHTGTPTLLQSLCLRDCTLPTDIIRKTLVETVWKHPRLASLNHLDLEGAIGCDDTITETIAECLGELESTNISSTMVTGVGVKAMIQKTKLKRLVANDCHAISHDAVEWARQQGVQVERRVNDGLSGGKRVRH